MQRFVTFFLMLTFLKLFIPLSEQTKNELCYSQRINRYENNEQKSAPHSSSRAIRRRINQSNDAARIRNIANAGYRHSRCMNRWHLAHRIRIFRWGIF